MVNLNPLLCLLLSLPSFAMRTLEQSGPPPESPRSLSSHHHLAITIDRDSPIHEPQLELPPNRLRVKLAIISAVTAIITAGITATVTILTLKRGC